MALLQSLVLGEFACNGMFVYTRLRTFITQSRFINENRQKHFLNKEFIQTKNEGKNFDEKI